MFEHLVDFNVQHESNEHNTTPVWQCQGLGAQLHQIMFKMKKSLSPSHIKSNLTKPVRYLVVMSSLKGLYGVLDHKSTLYCRVLNQRLS